MSNNHNQEDFYVIDAHCDTLMAIVGRSMNKEERDPRNFFADNNSVHLDLPKLSRGHVACQVMAIFLEDSQLSEATREAMAMIDSLESLLRFDPREFFLARNSADIYRALETKSVCALLSIEGAEALGDSLESLEIFYQRGVRAIGLTWNRRNAFWSRPKSRRKRWSYQSRQGACREDGGNPCYHRCGTSRRRRLLGCC